MLVALYILTEIGSHLANLSLMVRLSSGCHRCFYITIFPYEIRDIPDGYRTFDVSLRLCDFEQERQLL